MKNYIYTLELEQGKYYIGRTNSIGKIPNILMNSEWIDKYKPIKIKNVISSNNEYNVDKYTINYMNMYGIDNVRGGSYKSIVLNKEIIEHLKQICNELNTRCYLKCKKV